MSLATKTLRLGGLDDDAVGRGRPVKELSLSGDLLVGDDSDGVLGKDALGLIAGPSFCATL